MFLKTKQIDGSLHQKKQEKKEDLNMICKQLMQDIKIELEERTMEIYGYCMYEWQIFYSRKR